MLFDFIFRVREGFGIVDQCSQLNIARFRVTISVRDFQVTANCPKCRVFAIDSQTAVECSDFQSDNEGAGVD